jgi:thiol-disulfide isomerase/thioredoxin
MAKRKLESLALAGVLASTLVGCQPSAETASTGVKPGEEAPALGACEWIRGDAIQQYDPGHVYVVDLWATWCMPCLNSMPHLRRLETVYPDEVTVVAMNVWEFRPENIPAFVKDHGDSMPSRIALDHIPPGKEGNEGLVALALLGTQEHISIPRTFVIDGSGRVAWIGEPLEVDGPLKSIVSGTWDSAAFAESYSREMEVELRYRELFAPVEAAVQQGDWESAVEASGAVAAADSAFGDRIANQGFAYVAMQILHLETHSETDLTLAQAAVDRAIALKLAPDWRLYLLGAQVANAAGDSGLAARYLDSGIAVAPPEERARFLGAEEVEK